MIASDVSYALNALLSAGMIGTFSVGKKRGRGEAQDETIQTLQDLVSALKDRVEILTEEKRDQAILIEKQAVWIEYLRGMVLGASPNLVPPGTLPDLHGPGRGSGPANPSA